jgi:hypothetical protein
VRVTRLENALTVALFDGVFPSGGDPRLPRGAAELQVGRFVDDLYRRGPQPTVLGIRLVFLLLGLFAPLLMLGRFRTVLGLSPEQRATLLERMHHSRFFLVRELPLLVKTMGALGYCALPEVQRGVGIPHDGTPPSWAQERS